VYQPLTWHSSGKASGRALRTPDFILPNAGYVTGWRMVDIGIFENVRPGKAIARFHRFEPNMEVGRDEAESSHTLATVVVFHYV